MLRNIANSDAIELKKTSSKAQEPPLSGRLLPLIHRPHQTGSLPIIPASKRAKRCPRGAQRRMNEASRLYLLTAIFRCCVSSQPLHLRRNLAQTLAYCRTSFDYYAAVRVLPPEHTLELTELSVEKPFCPCGRRAFRLYGP